MKFFFIAKFWVPLAFVTTILCGLIFLSVQQNLRMGANDPQIQMAEDGAVSLEESFKPQDIVGSKVIDIGKSLSPFVIVYNTSGTVTASSGKLNGQVPSLPRGVLEKTYSFGENRITWQPQSGVRIAAVIVASSKGYVLAGRSLREVEMRESSAELYAIAAWITSLVGSFIISFLLSYDHGKRKNHV